MTEMSVKVYYNKTEGPGKINLNSSETEDNLRISCKITAPHLELGEI